VTQTVSLDGDGDVSGVCIVCQELILSGKQFTSTSPSAAFQWLSCFYLSEGLNSDDPPMQHGSLSLASSISLACESYLFRSRVYFTQARTTLSRLLFMGGTSCIIIGFSFATEIGCKGFRSRLRRNTVNPVIGSAPSTLALIIIGTSVLICGGIYENFTTRDCLFPQTAFRSVTSGILQVESHWNSISDRKSQRLSW